MRDQLLLMFLALALYVYDCLYLLRSDQGVLIRSRRAWRAAFGSNSWRLRFKEPYLANLLTPHVPLLVLTWRFDEQALASLSEGALDPRAQLPRLRSLSPYILGATFSMFVLLPIGLFSQIGPAFTLGSIALIYANILGALFALAMMRKSLGLSTKRYWQIAAESILCAPLALNLIRKVDREVRADVASNTDFIAAAKTVLDSKEFAGVLVQCVERLNEQIDFEQEGSARMMRLLERRAALRDGPKPGDVL